jgi:electron transport complex protein RnfE
VLSGDHSLLIALLPPGAFFALGLLLAGKNWIDGKLTGRLPQTTQTALPVTPANDY